MPLTDELQSHLVWLRDMLRSGDFLPVDVREDLAKQGFPDSEIRDFLEREGFEDE